MPIKAVDVIFIMWKIFGGKVMRARRGSIILCSTHDHRMIMTGM